MTTINHLDYSHFDGGLVRMMNRFKEEGTLTGDFDADEQIRASGNVALLGLLYDQRVRAESAFTDRKSTRLNSSHVAISYAVFCLKKKRNRPTCTHQSE